MKYCYLYFVNRFVLETDILKHTVLDVYVNSQIILFDSLVFFKQLKNNNDITALKMYLFDYYIVYIKVFYERKNKKEILNNDIYSLSRILPRVVFANFSECPLFKTNGSSSSTGLVLLFVKV